ncbi:MAG: hypothetical protein Q7R66_00300 [Undibacterium sp.]|nr:hypothetical protein [Undibacterium sp.]
MALIVYYFFGAHGFAGEQGLSEDRFFFFFPGAQGLLGPHGFSAFSIFGFFASFFGSALLSVFAGRSAAISAGAGATNAVAINNADKDSASLCFVCLPCFI